MKTVYKYWHFRDDMSKHSFIPRTKNPTAVENVDADAVVNRYPSIRLLLLYSTQKFVGNARILKCELWVLVYVCLMFHHYSKSGSIRIREFYFWIMTTYISAIRAEFVHENVGGMSVYNVIECINYIGTHPCSLYVHD